MFELVQFLNDISHDAQFFSKYSIFSLKCVQMSLDLLHAEQAIVFEISKSCLVSIEESENLLLK